MDAYRAIKQRYGELFSRSVTLYAFNCKIVQSYATCRCLCRENEASLAVLPDLLAELDAMNEVMTVAQS